MFAPALHAAYEKIDEYYEKTTESPTYIMSMSTVLPIPCHLLDPHWRSLVLNPNEKMGYFKKHWPAYLHDDVLKCVKGEVHSSGSNTHVSPSV